MKNMIDTLFINNEPIPVNIIETSNDFNWEPYFLLVATLSLIAAVIIPFAQRIYDELRTKRSFKLYLKKQIGFILNFLISEKIEYQEPTIKKKIKRKKIKMVK